MLSVFGSKDLRGIVRTDWWRGDTTNNAETLAIIVPDGLAIHFGGKSDVWRRSTNVEQDSINNSIPEKKGQTRSANLMHWASGRDDRTLGMVPWCGCDDEGGEGRMGSSVEDEAEGRARG